jgi:Flp pilus assembly protein TadG
MESMKMRTRQAERGIAVIATTIMLVILIPVIGLALDVTLLYVDKAKLQGAVDGAALAGAESLARGDNDSAQQTAAKQAAASYVFLNYPSSFFFTNSVTVNQATDVTIDETVANQRTVAVTAHANVPTLFMRWLNFTSTNVNASATVTRRDVNVVIVQDRSGSLAASGSCAATQQAAINFVNKFSNGSDNVGLVTFASSTNADFPIANNFQTASPNVVSMINAIACEGSTSSAMALWYGYDQLVGLNQPNALNVILFFTDGKPTVVNVNMPYNTAQHTCTSAHSGTPPYINGVYGTYTSVDQWLGIGQATNNGTIVGGDGAPTTDASSGAGCFYMQGYVSPSNWPNESATSDFLGLPLTDVYGDQMTGSGAYLSVVPSGGYIPFSPAQNADYAVQNAADYAAQQIRAGATEQGPLPHAGSSLRNVIIYTVGLGNAPYPLSVPLLQRISNVPASPIYIAPPTEQQGDFILAPTSADINAAFATIAAEILRLAK